MECPRLKCQITFIISFFFHGTSVSLISTSSYYIVILPQFAENGAFVFQLPRMLETDAVARYYGLGKGTVIKITYASKLTGNHVTYRCIL